MEEIVCNGCALLCDDVTAEISGMDVKSLGMCRLGHAHLSSALKYSKEIITSTEDSVEQVAEILQSAESLLLYGWSRSTNEAIQEGIKLAKILKAPFETHAGHSQIHALSHPLHGSKLEIDLEYARNNGEFIIYWGSDPSESSHRHPSRFAVLPRGEKIPEGIESRTIGVVDVRETETMKMANHRLIIPPGSDVALLKAVTGEVSGKSSLTESVVGISPTELIAFSKNLLKADCTVIFYGSGFLNSGKAKENLGALAELLKAIRKSGKEAFALPMAHESNIMGAAEQTTESSETLKRLFNGEFDVVLVVGDDPLAELPGSVATALVNTRLLYIGPKGNLTGNQAEVPICTVNDILAGAGTLNRMDGHQVELKPWNTEADITKTELQVIRKLCKIVSK
ncbi:MAG: hypothetical protein ACFE7R_02920 [Candidatus Hodarchaeota archaeon]